MKNQDIINKYFEGYAKHDLEKIKEVMSENVTWYFMGQHPLAGIKHGIKEVVAFFDKMAAVMGKSKPNIEKLIVSENDKYAIECIHSRTNNDNGINLDHHACVLWTFENGKIIEGRHFFAEPQAVDDYFSRVAANENIVV